MSAAPFVYRRLVQFADTDMAGIVHFSALFRIMEEAEHAFLRSLGLTVYEAHGGVTWPRVSVKADFHSPARFEDELEVAVSVAAMTSKAVTYALAISSKGRKTATGAITAVCCRYEGTLEERRLKSTAIPEEIVAKLTPHLSEGT